MNSEFLMMEINANLDKISDPNKILMIIPIKNGSKFYYGAVMTKSNGENKVVPLTKKYGWFSFTFSIDQIRDVVSDLYIKHFLVIDDVWAVNQNLLKGFSFKETEGSKKGEIFAEFKDGSNLYFRKGKKSFYNELAKSWNSCGPVRNIDKICVKLDTDENY